MLYTVIRRNVPQLFALRRSLPPPMEGTFDAPRQPELPPGVRNSQRLPECLCPNQLGLAECIGPLPVSALSTSCRSASSVAATLSTEKEALPTTFPPHRKTWSDEKAPPRPRLLLLPLIFSPDSFFPGTFRGGILSQEYGKRERLSEVGRPKASKPPVDAPGLGSGVGRFLGKPARPSQN